jgi:hypothetical protein
VLIFFNLFPFIILISLHFLSVSIHKQLLWSALLCSALRVELDSPALFHLIASSHFSLLFLWVCKFASLRVSRCERSCITSRSHKHSIIRQSDVESNMAHDPMLGLLCRSTALLLEEKKV